MTGKGWQDKLFLVGGFFFAASLVPAVIDPRTHFSLWSSLPTYAFLVAYAYAFRTLGLKLAMLGALAGAALWLDIALLRS